ncbi:MAG: flagellar assembly protein FliH, partial [Bacteriovoracaceae bacterium]|nr:flagellar assembly protein FliH [Bacteriovoracaceae bacterium]
IKNLTKWITLKELDNDGKYLERLMEKLLLEIQTRSNLLIQVNMNDFQKMPEVLEVVQARLGEIKNVRIEIDPAIETRGLIVESDNGIINATLEEQFKGLDKLFEQVLVESQEN